MESKSELDSLTLANHKYLARKTREVVKKTTRLPLISFVGADSDYYSREIPYILGDMIESHVIPQKAIINWSTTEGINVERFDKDVAICSSRIFFGDIYRGQFLDLLKIYYWMENRAGNPFPELQSISTLYTGSLSFNSLLKLSEQAKFQVPKNIEQMKQDEKNQVFKRAVKRIIQRLIDPEFAKISSAARFLQWVGTVIPVFILVDGISAPTILVDKNPNPEQQMVRDRLLELFSSSINPYSTKKSFQKVGVPIIRKEEASSPWLTALDKRLQKSAEMINTKTIVEGEEKPSLLDQLAQAKKSKNKAQIGDITNQLKRAKLTLDINREATVSGNSNYILFIKDIDVVNKKFMEKAYCHKEEVDRPDYEFHYGVIANVVSDLVPRIEKTNIVISNGWKSLVEGTAGLTSLQVEQAIKLGIEEQVYEARIGKKKDEDTNLILKYDYFDQHTNDLISDKDYLDMPKLTYGFEKVAGHKFNKSKLLKHVIVPASRPSTRHTMPPGICLGGPPGTGKSWITYALGFIMAKLGYKFVKLDIGALMRGIVGETDEITRELISLLKSLGRVVLFIDEIDTVLAKRNGGSNDSGVTQRLLGKLLDFFGTSEFKGKLLLVGATNLPLNIGRAMLDRMPLRFYFAELQRQGIIDMVKINLKQQEEVMGIELKYEGSQDKIAGSIYDTNESLAGRELVDAIDGLIREALPEEGDLPQTLLLSVENTKGFIQSLNVANRTDNEEYQEMVRQGKQLATFQPEIEHEYSTDVDSSSDSLIEA